MTNRDWERISAAFKSGTDAELWLAWRVGFQRRFWKDLGHRTAALACAAAGIDHAEVLRRLTAYEFSPRDKAADLARLEAELKSSSSSL